MRRAAGVLGLVAGAALWAGVAGAIIVDVGLNATSPLVYLFPNWVKTEVVDFDTIWGDGTTYPGQTDATIRGITIINYGTAVGGTDIKNVYTCFGCSRSSGGACTPGQTLTYAGLWNMSGTMLPAWTWSGNLALNADPCNGGPGGCACIFVMRVFVDITACPTNGATVRLGPGYNDNESPPGGITDNYLSTDFVAGPWSDLADPSEKTIVYAVKTADKDTAAPGDTVSYTVFYGRPGTVNLADVQVMDTLPTYMHFLSGTAVPAPDAGWDPNWGPPIALRWTIPPPHPVLGGPTAQVTFKATIDWGNGEGFEPGSGDVGAPETSRLQNQAQVFFDGITGCGVTQVTTPSADTVVQRFLFWKVADNDILFSPSYGQPPDEITYSIFVRNMSAMKTWWDVRIWDSVPALLDSWCAGCGMEDPCLGWTMTPGGCASGTPGRTVSGATTLLTWRLDMPPGSTITLRWKGQVKATTGANTTAINQAKIQEMGRTSIIDGTGGSITPRSFTHLANIVLPTTYISYVGMAASDCVKCNCPGFLIDFFPLNKKSQFELRELQYSGAGWATTGGVSASIGNLIGDCLGGFPGGGIPGCKIERIPAKFDPVAWNTGTCPTFPFDFIYKLTSNSPVLWQAMTHVAADNQDNHTYAPATTLTYAGFMHYAWRRTSITQNPGYGDSLSLISTGMDPYGVYQAAQPTTVHLFSFDYPTNTWTYRHTYEIGPESQAIDMGTPAADEGPWRTISSDCALIVNEGNNIANTLGCCCSQCADNFGAFMPTRETGNVVSNVGSGHFYGLVQGYNEPEKVVIGNTGVADASYRIWKYIPSNTVAVPPTPSMLNGTIGVWVPVTTGLAGFGLANPTNPQDYGAAFNAPSTALFKVELLSGGPVQVVHGVRVYSIWSGGGIIHAANGQQTGNQFWLHHVNGQNSCGGGPGFTNTQVVDVFCPKVGMVVRGQSEDGYSATYTTNGPDQCIAFTAFTNPAVATKRNYRYDLLTAGGVIAQYIQCSYTEKGYTAPFLATGVHYEIIMPPVAYAGQSFWITVIALSGTGGTETDYCGTTSFTSTDPTAQMVGTGMDAYNYTWDSNAATATCKGVCCSGGADNGVAMFINVIFTRLGSQTVVAVDTADGSIVGVGTVMIVGADVKIDKRPALTVGASGDTVQFQVCWSNYSSASAFTFVITDAIPDGTTFLPEAGTAAFDCGNTDGLAPVVGYNTTASATPPAAGWSNANPIVGTHWLRFTLPMAGVGTTGCACYRVVIN